MLSTMTWSQQLKGGDFLIGKAGVDSSATTVIESFGAPHHISRVYNHYTHPDSDVVYTYDSLEVLLNYQNIVVAFDITGSGLSTARDIRVGDSISKVRKKYGDPSEEGENNLSYFEPNSALGITFRFHRTRVHRIHIGWHGD